MQPHAPKPSTPNQTSPCTCSISVTLVSHSCTNHASESAQMTNDRTFCVVGASSQPFSCMRTILADVYHLDTNVRMQLLMIFAPMWHNARESVLACLHLKAWLVIIDAADAMILASSQPVSFLFGRGGGCHPHHLHWGSHRCCLQKNIHTCLYNIYIICFQQSFGHQRLHGRRDNNMVFQAYPAAASALRHSARATAIG